MKSKTISNKLVTQKNKVMPVIAASLAMITPCFAAPVSLDPNAVISKVFLIFFGALEVWGIFDIATGGIALYGANHDDGGGQDVNAANKGKSKLIKGALILASPWIVTFITGIDPFNVNLF